MGKLKRKNIHPDELTQKQKDHLKLMDFLGRLSENEIVVAKKHGLYKCDAYVKKRDGKKHVLSL